MENISFNNTDQKEKFKNFVCDNKDVIDTFLSLFRDSVKNPIVKLVIAAIQSAIKNICA